jgi:LPS export ABC transporter permease LptG/LPS export ABC transporter permease LptF
VRILTRYILGEILSHTFIGCALFTFILFMRELPHILDMVVRNSSTFNSVMEVVVFLLPNFLMVTIPMAVLVGVLLGLSRLASDSEIIAMRASGLGIGYFVRVAAIVAVGGTLIGLFNSLYVAPRANQGILDLDKVLATQASYEIQPRVFYEDFKNTVLYVQDVRSGTGAANWRQVFMADITDPGSPKITTAASAIVVSDTSQQLIMRLRNGTEHDPVAGHPEQYDVSTFAVNDLPFAASQQNEGHLGRLDTNIYALPMNELIARTHGPDGKRFQIELHKRFAYPAACLVLMLVGVPLGVTSRRGGKSSAWVFTILLVILYYSLSLIGIALGRQNWIPAFIAVWSANILFVVGGLFLLWQMASGGQPLAALAGFAARPPKPEPVVQAKPASAPARGILNRSLRRFRARFRAKPQRNAARGAFPRILDEYVVLEFLNMFALVLLGFMLLMLVFTVFDLLSDILRNHIAMAKVGEYLMNLTPMFLYQLAPLAVLIAVLVTFGVLNRNSEIIAMKATGISLYRLVVPIVAIAAILAVSLFLFDEFYLPQANKRQDALRNEIKGKPPQTVTHPEQNWIFGEPRPHEPGRIFYYKFFDPDRKEFANISVFEFDPSTFALTRRIFAETAIWDAETGTWRFRNGWENDIEGDHTTGFHEFAQTGFAEIHEDPGYFNKESLQAQEMNFGQLDRYISDLRQSGFDTMKLRVALWHKLAYPVVAIVMAVLGIPFALSMGRRGSLTGIAVAIGVALTYFVVESLFGALGNVDYLPAALAAWSSDILFGLVGGYLLLRTPT